MTETAHEFKGKTILIAGPQFHDYLNMIATGFESFGMRTKILEWTGAFHHPLDELGSLISRKHGQRINRLREDMNSRALEHTVIENAPDYVLIVAWVGITEHLQEFCHRTGTKIILWAYDSAYHVPMMGQTAQCCDLVYVYEPTDLKLFRHMESVKYLPLAYDPMKYFPMDLMVDKSTDLCFVGTLNSPRRPELLRYVADQFPNLSIRIWSDSRKWYSPLRLKDFMFTLGRRNLSLTRRTIDHSNINEIYNSSKICLNVHHPQSKKGVNPRTFEILGSGGLLLTDKHLESIEGFECGRDYIFYSSTDGLLDSICSLIENQEKRELISRSGYSVVRNRHTYRHRAFTILTDLQQIM